MQIEIVTHSFGPFYFRLLDQQLRSLDTIPNAAATVFVWKEDMLLIPAIMGGVIPPGVWCPLGKPQLLNRTIGRNMAAKATTADWIWFTDADYLFGPGSLESLANLDPHTACMYYPRRIMRPAATDYFEDLANDVNPMERCTVAHRTPYAIGGAQIVPGHIARQWGYLDGVRRYQQPATGDKFLDTRGDAAYRVWLAKKTGLPTISADIPNVFRLRHRIPETSARNHLLPMVPAPAIS
jgi:hypothetical protein